MALVSRSRGFRRADMAKVRVAFSSNAGVSFGAPIYVDANKPFGRVDVALLEGGDAPWARRARWPRAAAPAPAASLNPASADDGEEWWFASVKTTTDWRRVAVPFARLRSINPKSDGRLDLAKLRAIVFLLDRGSPKPGSAGAIALDDVAVY